jgi:hypothetical protein
MKVGDSDVLAWVQGQRKMSQVLGACWISPCYGPKMLRAHFETDEPFIYLFNFPFFSGCGKPWITETADKDN